MYFVGVDLPRLIFLLVVMALIVLAIVWWARKN